MNIQLIELLQQQRLAKVEEGNALMAKLGDIQAEIGSLDHQIRVEQSGHLRQEFLAQKERAFATDHNRRLDAAAQRFAEQESEKQARIIAAQEYARDVAAQHKERADKEAAAEKARREQLVAEGWIA